MYDFPLLCCVSTRDKTTFSSCASFCAHLLWFLTTRTCSPSHVGLHNLEIQWRMSVQTALYGSHTTVEGFVSASTVWFASSSRGVYVRKQARYKDERESKRALNTSQMPESSPSASCSQVITLTSNARSVRMPCT